MSKIPLAFHIICGTMAHKYEPSGRLDSLRWRRVSVNVLPRNIDHDLLAIQGSTPHYKVKVEAARNRTPKPNTDRRRAR